MTAATATDLPKLTHLERGSAMPEYALLGEPFPELLKQRSELLTQATAARSAYERAQKRAREARVEDTRAYADALTAGKADPGTKAEDEAIEGVHAAHRLAEAATLAANTANRTLASTLKSEVGQSGTTALRERMEKLQGRLGEEIETVQVTFSEINQLARVIETVLKAKRQDRGLPSPSKVRATPVYGGSSTPADPTVVLEGLKNYQPTIAP